MSVHHCGGRESSTVGGAWGRGTETSWTEGGSRGEAIKGARAGELLLSEALTLRARALVGRGGGGPHWAEAVGKQRLSEVMGQMVGERGALEALMLGHVQGE